MSLPSSLRAGVAQALRGMSGVTHALAFRVAARAAGPQPPRQSLPPLRRIAVLHFHAIGDLLMATPALRALGRRHQDARIDVLCSTNCAELLRYNPYVHHIRPQGQPPHRRHLRGLLGFGRHLAFLRHGRYDAVVDLTGFVYSAWLTYASQAPHRLGFVPPGMRVEATWPLYTAAIPRDPRRHFIEEGLALAALLDAPADGERMDLSVGQEARQSLQAWLAHAGLSGARLAILHPGAKWPPKRWAAPRFAALTAWLSHEMGLTPILVGAKEDASIFEAIRSVAGHVTVFDPGLRLLGLGALLERAVLFIGNDSGPMHVARAVGTPTIGLFGPTDPHRYGPRGPAATVVSVPIECRPCRMYFTADTCERGHNYCLDGVTLSAVQAAVRCLMDTAPSIHQVAR